MKQFRNPPDVHPPLVAYSHQVEVTGDERLLILSGQVGRHLDGSVPEDALEQLQVACENLQRNLYLASMEMGDLVKLTLYLVGEMDGQKRAQVLRSWLGDHRPCMTLVFVVALASSQYKVELDAWASKSR